jgi:protein phosphatase
MGAAVSGVLFREKSALVFNCGDCRVYRFSGGRLERVSRDHSVVQELFEQGAIDEEGMRTHPKKNVITSAVSVNMSNFGGIYSVPLSRIASDEFFICSDGVWEVLSGAEIADFLAGRVSSGELFEKMMERGCHDNVSFIKISG